MQRIATSTKDVDKFGAGKHGFTEGDPSVGEAATQISDDWLNSVQEALARTVEDSGQALDAGTYTQMAGAVKGIGRQPTFCHKWTERTSAKNFNLEGVSHDGYGLWVAVGNPDGVDAYMLSSITGEVWSEVVNPKNFILKSVAHNKRTPGAGGLWVAVGGPDGADAYIVTSPDGAAWTERANPKNFSLYGVATDGAGNLLAVGSADGSDAYMLSSSNGTSWVEVANPQNIGLAGVVYASHLSAWVCVGSATGSGSYALVGNPGSWYDASASMPEDLTMWGVAYDGLGVLVGVGGRPTTPWADANIVTSISGRAWRHILNTGGAAEGCYDIAYDTVLGSFVAVGEIAGGDPFISQSELAGAPT